MSSQKSFMNKFILIALLLLPSVSILAQHQHNSDSTKTDMKKMNCCKTMSDSTHEMKTEKSEMSGKNNIDLGMVDKNKDGKVYQCPMCADQLTDDQGECPKCGMDLKEISLEKAKENLIKNGFKVK
jgi:rubrerythrin